MNLSNKGIKYFIAYGIIIHTMLTAHEILTSASCHICYYNLLIYKTAFPFPRDWNRSNRVLSDARDLLTD